MNAVRKRKLYWILFCLFIMATVTALISYALSQNISLFFSPSQVFSENVPFKQKIRLGGMVEKGSLMRPDKDLLLQFRLTDYKHTITVHYRGILPDLFREGQGIVVFGEMLDKTNFKAEEVLAKHDANYMPAELKKALGQVKQPKPLEVIL